MSLIIEDSSFDLLKVLIAVAESKNFREAAVKLKISQPAVTVKLRELERFHPAPLFSVEGKRKVLTHYGRSLYEAAKASTRHLQDSIESLHRNYASAANLTIRLGGRPDVLRYIAPALRFEGRIEFHNCTSSEAVQKLKDHEIDIALTYVLPDSTDYTAKKLFSSHMHFCIHEKLLKKHSLNKDFFKDKELLKNLPCISYGGRNDSVINWTELTGMDYNDLNIRYVTEDWRTVQTLINEGFGYGVLPFYSLNLERGVKNLILPSQVSRPFDFYAVFESSLKKVEAFKPFLKFEGVGAVKNE